MIVRITFEDESVMMFGDSYKPWHMQMDEFMRRCADGLARPKNVEESKSKWVAWGGLKWCSEDGFQHQLNREGSQEWEPDNPNPRQYIEMTFVPAKNKAVKLVMEAWKDGQELLQINKLTTEEYKRYRKGELKITV